ncbi:MAG: hypothetical protein JST10_04880 [Bacteroidetes bacterium]|nr:hypothetical protein [Bacteroidota bacterium]
MEVHAHTHHGKKKWTEYLWEFLMLFLAVFCGFLAENGREHLVEHQREKQYMRSLAEDLKTDIIQSNDLAPQLKNLVARLDSLTVELTHIKKEYPPLIVFKQLSENIGFPDYVYTDRTMQQLKNAGGMRLIRKSNVADSIVQYDARVRRSLGHQEFVNSSNLPRLFDKINSSLNVAALNHLAVSGEMDSINLKKKILLTNDPKEMILLNNQIIYYRLSINIMLVYVRQNKKSAENLLSLIQREYHLK